MKVADLINRLNSIYPEYCQENYDNTGQQVIFHDDDIKKVYISLDVDGTVIEDAKEKGCNIIICHHPLMFRPVKKIVSAESRSSLIIDIIRVGISIYSLHTNFDKFMYSYLAETLGYKNSRVLLKTDANGDKSPGFGSFIMQDETVILEDLLENVKKTLDVDYLIFTGSREKQIRSIAFLNGAGGNSIEKIINSDKPDCIITGDVGYHNARYALDSGTAVIDAGHFGTEIIFKKMLAQTVEGIMNDCGQNIDIVLSDVEKNPLRLYI